jgi:type III secretion protein L
MLIKLNGDGALGCEHGILKADAAQTLVEAQQAREEARRECEAARAQARAEAEQIVTTARESAQALLKEAQEHTEKLAQEARRSVDEAVQRAHEEALQTAVSQWHQQQAENAANAAKAAISLEARLAAIVTTAVESIIAARPRSALYERALRHVQSLTRGATTLTLRVHPDDQEHARQGLGPVKDNAVVPCEIVPDLGLARGSAIFESEFGVLDASLGTQLAALQAALKRALGHADEPPEGANGIDPDVPVDDPFFFGDDDDGDDDDDEDGDDEDEDDEDEQEHEDEDDGEYPDDDPDADPDHDDFEADE